MQRYFSQKVKQYISQDIEAERSINAEDYVNVEWLMSQLKTDAPTVTNPL